MQLPAFTRTSVGKGNSFRIVGEEGRQSERHCRHKLSNHPARHSTGRFIFPFQVKPAAIVDKLIDFWLTLVIPGRGAGERTWWMQGLRSLEQQSERTAREIDVRAELRRWDREYPQIHHELIVRWVCGAAVSLLCTTLYNGIVRPGRPSSVSSSRRYDR
jgi:hypothetical protein